jgi:hypothetical protein
LPWISAEGFASDHPITLDHQITAIFWASISFVFLRVLCGKWFWFPIARGEAATDTLLPTGVKAFKKHAGVCSSRTRQVKRKGLIATSQLLTVPFGCRPFRIEPLWIDPPTPLSVFPKRILSEQRLGCQV